MKRPAWIGVYEVPVILAMVTVVAVCAVKRSFFFSGSVLGASLIAYGLAFFLTSYGLKRQGLGFERIFYAVAGAAAARWLFEILYHYAFPISFDTVLKDLENLSTNISESSFPLLWSIMMVIVIFTGYRYMAVGKLLWVSLVASVVSFGFWILIGYPQWVHPEQWPVRQPLIYLIPPKYAHAPNDAARSAISLVSLIVNSTAKVAVCTLLPTLFLRRTRNKGKASS